MEDTVKRLEELVEKFSELVTKEQRIKYHLEKIKKIVPTMIFVGMTEQNEIALYTHSPKEDENEQLKDHCYTIVTSMKNDPNFRSILNLSLMYYLTRNAEKWQELKSEIEMLMK